MVVRWSFLAVADVTANTLVSRALAAGSTVTPWEASALLSAGMAVEMLSPAACGVPPCRNPSSEAA